MELELPADLSLLSLATMSLGPIHRKPQHHKPPAAVSGRQSKYSGQCGRSLVPGRNAEEKALRARQA